MTPEEFRTVGYQIVDWIAEYRAQVADYPVRSGLEPGQIKAALPAVPPDNPESFEAILGDLNDTILPGISHFSHQQPSSAGHGIEFPAISDRS